MPSRREWLRWSAARCHPKDARAGGATTAAAATGSSRLPFSRTTPSAKLCSGGCSRFDPGRRLVEDVVVEERLGLHLLSARRRLKVLYVQRERVWPQNLVPAQ